MQEEIDEQYLTIRYNDKAIRNGSKECENLKKDYKKLNKERDKEEKRLKEKIKDPENQLEVECRELKQGNELLKIHTPIIAEYNKYKHKMIEELDHLDKEW